jgi:hypothetical protein
MKTKRNFARKSLIISTLVTLTLFAFTACTKTKDDNNNKNRMYAISGNANGNQVVPPVSDSATGSISGTFNQSTGQLITTTSWSGLTGNPISGGFYNGASGTNGSLVGASWALGPELTATGSFNDTLTLTNDQATQLINGDLYYSLGTTANPNGEIRGQITATPQ